MSKTKENSEKWKTMDMQKVVRQDIMAALGLLQIIVENKDIFDRVVEEMEKLRTRLINNQKQVPDAPEKR